MKNFIKLFLLSIIALCVIGCVNPANNSNGDDKKKTEHAFKMVFVKDYVTGHSVKQCPNCGASVKDETRVDCQYCGTVFDNSNYDWYLESKVKISEN